VAGDLLTRHPGQIELLAPAGNLTDVIARVAQAQVHLGQRYHGHVLAAMAGVPFAGLAHDRKIVEVCRSFSMPCLAVEDVKPDVTLALIDAATHLHINPAVLNDLRAAARLNVDALREVMM
jgi:polysaccharide pyruvyl transferase WcaK-like protein